MSPSTAIYPDEINNFNDYIKYSARLKPLLKTHVQSILNSGISVMLDFPGNTKQQRAWFKEIFSEFNIPHKLVYIEADDELCLKQIEARKKNNPDRARFDNEEVFRQVTRYFQIPSKINYVEFPACHIQATKDFFATVFGWSFEDFGPEYTAFSNQGLDGGFFKSEQSSSTDNGAALIVFYSSNLEKTLEAIENAGGRRFHFIEPSGNELAVWSDVHL